MVGDLEKAQTGRWWKVWEIIASIVRFVDREIVVGGTKNQEWRCSNRVAEVRNEYLGDGFTIRRSRASGAQFFFKCGAKEHGMKEGERVGHVEWVHHPREDVELSRKDSISIVQRTLESDPELTCRPPCALSRNMAVDLALVLLPARITAGVKTLSRSS